MIRSLVLALALVMGFSVTASAGETAGSPGQVVTAFYTAVLALKQGGIPNAKALKKLSPYLSPELERLLADGQKAEASYGTGLKGIAPPLLEGDLFTSMYEGANAFKVEACTIKAGSARCPVALRYEPPDEKPQHWTDTAVLIETAKGWRVDDVDYGGDWAFANKGTLKDNLAYAIQNARGAGQ